MCPMDTRHDMTIVNQTILTHITANIIADHPDHIESRALKQCRKHYPFITSPREQLRVELMKTYG
jgi:hypothetical protein